jgi:hypothetical protein
VREAGAEARPVRKSTPKFRVFRSRMEIEGVAGYENEQKSDIRQQLISMKVIAGEGSQDDQS